MKISIDVNSPHFVGVANWGRYRVDLNGKRVPSAREADDVDGYVIFVLMDGNNRPIVDHVKGVVATEKLYGKVSITDLRPGAKAAPAGIMTSRT